jgi:hypothetical protein
MIQRLIVASSRRDAFPFRNFGGETIRRGRLAGNRKQDQTRPTMSTASGPPQLTARELPADFAAMLPVRDSYASLRCKGMMHMTGITLLGIIAAACLVRIAFVMGDIRDALYEVRSTLRKHLPALESALAKLDARNEKEQQLEAPGIASAPQEQRDRQSETAEDSLRSTAKADPDQELPSVSRLLSAWSEIRAKLVTTSVLRGPTNDADGKGEPK